MWFLLLTLFRCHISRWICRSRRVGRIFLVGGQSGFCLMIWGGDSVRRQDARRLLDEHRAEELRKRAVTRQQEQEAVEADRERRARIWKGLRADLGPHPATAMLAAAKAAQPRRVTPLQEALSGETLVYHSMQDEVS
jgi:hypothetical protein